MAPERRFDTWQTSSGRGLEFRPGDYFPDQGYRVSTLLLNEIHTPTYRLTGNLRVSSNCDTQHVPIFCMHSYYVMTRGVSKVLGRMRAKNMRKKQLACVSASISCSC